MTAPVRRPAALLLVALLGLLGLIGMHGLGPAHSSMAAERSMAAPTSSAAGMVAMSGGAALADGDARSVVAPFAASADHVVGALLGPVWSGATALPMPSGAPMATTVCVAILTLGLLLLARLRTARTCVAALPGIASALPPGVVRRLAGGVAAVPRSQLCVWRT